ncbi:uncharacterized protein OCT59_006189 [Rhizophagus irregularis]|nr:hypothetical protein OCT59_006189 [Rhizophagus irregularis]
MYEVIQGLPPYHDISHDELLAIKICQGLRPNFKIKVPQLILHLIKKCLDANQSNRPTSKEIKEILKEWREEINSRTHNSTELIKQIKEAEEMNNNLSAINTPSKFHENISNMEYSGTIVNNFVMLKLIVKE